MNSVKMSTRELLSRLFHPLTQTVVPIRHIVKVTMLWVVLLPYVFIGLGIASNQVVLIANHDKFPVMLNEASRVKASPDANGLIDEVHSVMTHQTHMNLLADIFDMHSATYSIGDFILMFGFWLNSFAFYVWVTLVVKSLLEKATNERQTAG